MNRLILVTAVTLLGLAAPLRAGGPLEITKRASGTVFRPGEVVRFSVEVHNRGQDQLTEVSVWDFLLPECRMIPSSNNYTKTGEWTLPAGELFLFNLGSLGPDERRTLLFDAVIAPWASGRSANYAMGAFNSAAGFGGTPIVWVDLLIVGEIPTASELGLIALALGLLGAMLWARRRAAPAAS